MDRAKRRTYFLAGGVLLVFLAINAWVAIDHRRIEVRTNQETGDLLDGARQLADQRTALLASRPDDGAIDLQMMRNARVRVPDSFIRDGHFASPWGSTLIIKYDDWLVWDFYEITTTGCEKLLAGPIPGVVRAATSGAPADEKPAPLTQELAVQECRRKPLIARLILR